MVICNKIYEENKIIKIGQVTTLIFIPIITISYKLPNRLIQATKRSKNVNKNLFMYKCCAVNSSP